MSNDILRTELVKPINSLFLEKDELKKIIETLQIKANEACKLESDYIENLPDLKGDINLIKENLNKCSLLKITIKGIKGEDLFGSIDEIFNTNIFPEKVLSVDGVFSQLNRFFLDKRIKFIHRQSTYDIIVWLLGIPYAFWACFMLSPFANNFFKNNTFLISAFFIYLFLTSLLVIRMLVHYFRWVFPMIEFRNKNDNSITHKTILYSITIAIFSKFLFDILKWLFGL